MGVLEVSHPCSTTIIDHQATWQTTTACLANSTADSLGHMRYYEAQKFLLSKRGSYFSNVLNTMLRTISPYVITLLHAWIHNSEKASAFPLMNVKESTST